MSPNRRGTTTPDLIAGAATAAASAGTPDDDMFIREPAIFFENLLLAGRWTPPWPKQMRQSTVMERVQKRHSTCGAAARDAAQR